MAILSKKEFEKIEYVPLVHAHWIAVDKDARGYCDHFRCSSCRSDVYTECGQHFLGDQYCRHCGAKMDEEEEADQADASGVKA